MLEFLSSNQGAGNAGKLLKVDTDGSVITAEVAGATVDDEMSAVSTNPVQNKVITETITAVNDRVDYLEDGLSEEVHHYSEITVFDTNITNPYATSTFCGWGASIGHPNRIDKVVVPYTVRANTPVSKCRLNIFRINEAITDADFASESSTSPRIGSKLELLATKTLEFEPITTAGAQFATFELDTPVLNPDDKTIMLEFLANNVISEGFAIISTKPQTVEAGYGPGVNWSSYTAASETPYTTFASGLTEKVGVATATCNMAGSNYNVRTSEANNQFYVFAGTVSYYEDDVEKILFNPERVDDLEDQLYDDIEHYEEHTTQNWMSKGSASYYATSTFSGWLGSIGRPDKIGWVEFTVRGRGESTPITQVRCRIYKMSRDLVESDYNYTEGSSSPYSNPKLRGIAVKVADKTLNFEEPITGVQRVRFDLDEIIDNTEEHCQYLVGYNCNNVVSGGFRIQNSGTSPFGGGFTGPWIAYTTWNGTTTSTDFDTQISTASGQLNLTGNVYDKEHLATPQYCIMEANVGYDEEWTERKITPDPDGKVGTIVQGVIEEMGIQEQLDEAMAATQLVQPASIIEYQGSSSLNLVDNPTSGYVYNDPTSTFDGECFPIGPVPAEVPIGGFRVPLKIRSYSPDTDARFRTANLAKVELWACDYTMENNTTTWSGSGSDPNFNPVKVAEKSIEIDLDLDNPEKLSGVYDFVFDEPFYNTEGKHLYLAYWINARICRPKVSGVSLLYYLNNKYDLGLTSVKAFYSAFTSKQTSVVENIMKANRWGNDNVIAFSIITAHDGYIASDLFNEWVDDRTGTTIVEEVEDYLDHHELPVPPSFEVRLPKKYTAVVGDTLQIFYDGIVKGVNVCDNADIYVVCSTSKDNKGRAFPRYWEFTPSATDIGTMTMTVYVRNFQGKIVSQGSTTIETVAVPTFESAKTVNMLIFGDSLTSSGSWAAEGIRRLVGTDTTITPASKQVANLTISTYGKKHNTVNTQSIYHEGYGGWTWGSFLQTSQSGSTVNGIYVTMTSAPGWDLNEYQHSIWTDQNNLKWKLEDIDGAKIKFDRGPGNTGAQSATQLPTQLVCASPVQEILPADISTTAWESGNPFYDDVTNRINFLAHDAELNHDPADVVGVLLTWNGGGSGWTNASGGSFSHQSKITTHLNNATTLIRDIHNDLPNAKVIVMGIQLSSFTGGNGANYGASGGYSDTIGTNYYAFDYDQQLEALVTNEEFGQYCYYVDTKGQFDTKWLMPYSNTKVNTRSTVTEPRGTNGVHPSEAGYYAIGDAFYRQLCKVLPTLS